MPTPESRNLNQVNFMVYITRSHRFLGFFYINGRVTVSLIKRILGHSKFFTLIAVISLALGITMSVGIPSNIGDIDVNLLSVGIIFYLMGVTMILPHFKNKTFLLKVVIIIELLLSQYMATIYFLLPAIGRAAPIQFGDMNHWIAIVILVHAFIHLFIMYLDRTHKHYMIFAFYVALTAIGGYIYSHPVFDIDRQDIIAYGFYLHAVLAAYYVSKKSSKKKDGKAIERKAKGQAND